MADIEPLLEQVEATLRTIGGLAVYDGHVPEKLPMSGSFIDPYVVIWAGLGNNPPELPADGRHDDSTTILDFQTTVVAATAKLTRQAGRAVAASLLNLPLGTGRVRPNPDSFNSNDPMHDPAITPSRFVLPIPWRLITN